MENGIIHYIEKNYTNDKIDHIGYYIRSRIKESKQLSPEYKETLLNFPVIYIHTWTKDEKKYVYVGETINLVRRTDEHAESANVDEQDYKWQEDWVKGENLTSVFFSHKEMNKSLTLDLEDSLIALFKADLGEDTVKNGRGNEYKGYSNCDLKEIFLRELWNILKNDVGIVDKTFDELISSNTELKNKTRNKDKIKNAPEFVIYDNQYTSWANLEDEIKKFFEKEQEKQRVILEYPVVYLHVWKNQEGMYQAYVGEAFNVIKRTEQHQVNNKENDSYYYENLINQDYEKENSWRDDWNVGSNKHMFIFGSKHMNKSLALDLENLLIKYMELCRLDGRNGRRNEQRNYDNRQELFPLFDIIVDYLSGKKGVLWPNDIFIKKQDIEKKSILVSSPFLDFSEDQRKIIGDVKEKILNSYTNLNAGGHSLLVIHGGAGTGKTVIASSLFFDLYVNEKIKKIKFIINSKELEKVYGSSSSWETLLGEKYKDIEKCIVPAQNHINEVQIAYMRIVLLHTLDTSEKKEELLYYAKPWNGDDRNPAGRHDRIRDLINQFVICLNEKKSENTAEDIPEELIRDCAKTLSGYEIENLFDTLKQKIPSIEEPHDYDVVLIDEAHLMYAKGTQGTVKDAQLPFIVKHTKTTVLFYDEKQYVEISAVVDKSASDLEARFKAILEDIEEGYSKDVSIELLPELDFQYRMHCSKLTEEWIKGLAKENAKIEKKPIDEENYEIKVFDNVDALVDAIQDKKDQKSIASLVATYNWKFKEGKESFIIIEGSKYQFIWHGTPKKDIWTKKSSLFNEKGFVEIGYYKDIQGLDLEYVGVIIGPSFSYSEGEGIKIDHECRPNTKNSNTGKENELIENELRVLLTRGVKGLYLFAVNDALRKKLLESTQ